MPGCEKCWEDAYSLTLVYPMKGQAEHYSNLILERENKPCSKREQAGQFWDEKTQCDKRTPKGGDD